MSVVGMLIAARAALADMRDRNRMHEELAALDDHALADIGVHRSQLRGTVERLYESVELDAAPPSVQNFARRTEAGLSAAQQWLRRI